MPYINVNDAYILDNTGKQVDDAVDYALYNSNRNLLDNWYFVGGGSQLGDGVFPINQRGQTSYSGALCIDRWHADDTVTIYSGYINTGNGTMYQVCDTGKITPLLGEAVTASLMLADGTIVSDTQVFPEDTNNRWVIFGSTGMASFLAGTSSQIMRLPGGNNIKAAKLEKGTVSTLANDVPPNFGAELRKCKRYLRYVPLTMTPAVIGGNTAFVTLNGIEMAGVPTPALISAGGARDAGGTQNITSATVTGFTYNTPTVQFALAGNLNSVIGYVYDTVVRLSCEL